MTEQILIDRPPRLQPPLPLGEKEIMPPPEKDKDGRERLLQLGLPLITILGSVLLSAMGGAGRSPLMLIPMGLSVIASTGFALYSYQKERRARADAEREYHSYLLEISKERQQDHTQQQRFYHYNYPAASTLLSLIQNTRLTATSPERALRTESRLWERRVNDDDFGVIRLGLGVLPSTVIYHCKAPAHQKDPQTRAALKIAAASHYVADIPVILSLRPRPETASPTADITPIADRTRTPAVSALAIAGAPSAVYSYTHALVAHFAVFHAPDDARLYLLAQQKSGWAWSDKLPHCQPTDDQRFCCFVAEIQPKAEEDFSLGEGDELSHFLEGLRKVLAQRKLRLQDRELHTDAADPTQPLLLVVIDLLDTIYDPAARLSQLMSDAAIALLLNEGAQLGAAVLFLVPERGKAPSGCEAVIEVERTAPHGTAYQILHYRFAEVGVNSARYVGEADAMHPDAMHELATALAQLEAPATFGADLASAVSFLDLLGYTTVAELVQETQHKWQQSCAPEHANWLQAKIGLMAGNKPRTLLFSAKHDGVHGMVAGSTGSGKSELLITFIMSMAVTYDPSVLNFVLVDYKGGGAFKELAALPHCVDVITNLGEEGVTRMFTAINAELKRRQALNANTGTKNIVDYRHRGLHQRHQPYPFLFIIIDEFAEMIEARPDFKNQLATITRVGRAQGVSLLLAAQRPSGVTDQMRANIKFRLCLRVETAGESREMLRRAEASYLPNGFAGRGYLQVGNEEIELIQIAYAGDPYQEPQSAPPPPVLWPQRHPGYDPERDQAPQPLYIELAQRLSQLAQAVAVPRQLAPWPDFLPATFALDSLLITQDPALPALTSSAYLTRLDQITFGLPTEEGLSLNPALNQWFNGSCGWIAAPHWRRHALRPVIGLIDDPANARQLPLVLDLPRGHVVIFGASGWGKTTLIRTLVISLTASHSPAYLHLYLLDLGGRNLNGLAALPHVGAIITPDEEAYRERVEQLLRELENHIERRKPLLQEAACQDLYQYNASRSLDNAPPLLPAIVVVIDNFLAFQETFGRDDGHGQGGEILTKFVALARQGRAYGVHFVITAPRLNSLPDALYNLFTERLTFKLTDTTDYRAIVGGLVNDIGEIPGRGYCKVGRAPLSFQVALPFEARRPVSGIAANETQEISRLAQYMQQYLAQSGQRVDLPLPIEALPHTILLEEILARQHGLTRTSTMREQLQTMMRAQWTKHQEPNLADWLRAAIGAISGNRLRELCMEATVDGVHGMVAGGTGSGKSELLMTLIVTLAIHYAPATLNFVLIDYKGGGAFAPLAGLPHCVDLVTNLSGAAVKRIFTAIKAEMERRQKLNTTTDTKDIVAYRKAGLHLTHAPYPYLFIIIDEYAEMIAANPEFKSELESITRLGRAQGVHLLLAAQKPMGVTDQMRENIKFRICLKVEGIDTSREMLRRADAAFIPDRLPGRGYLQIGNGPIELIQCAFAGAPCTYLPTEPGVPAPKFFAIVTELAQSLVDADKPRAPWPPPLPAQLSLTTAIHEADVTLADQACFTLRQPARLLVNPFLADWLAGHGAWPALAWPQQAMRAVAGLVDDPQRARLLPLTVDFTQGHAVIFGAPGAGKTTFLRTIVITLAATHSPAEFQAHLLDLGGRNLDSLQMLPHVGTVITKEEAGYEERVQQLLREVEAIIDQRKGLFSQSKVATLLEYNGRRPQPLAALIVAIDNFAEFSETFTAIAHAGGVEDPLATFVQLVRQAGAYGVYFVISANRLSEVPNKLYTLFTQRFALRLSDPGDYSAIVGAHAPTVEEFPGRGYIQRDQRILAFQVACLAVQDAAGNQHSEYGTIELLGQQMDHAIMQTGSVYQPPLSITALPRAVSYRHLWSELLVIPQDKAFMNGLQQAMAHRWEENGSAAGADWLKVPIGMLAGNRKRILAFEAKKDGVHGLVAGGTGSGKSELLMTLIVGLAINYSPEILNFVLVDYKGGGAFKPFTRLPHCVDLVTNLNKSAVHRMFSAISAEMQRRQKLNADTNTKDIIEYRQRGLHRTHQPYPHLFIIIDEYAELIDDNPEFRSALESITRVGRSIGVNLILASQRPKGVSEQMRANIKLRLCLRVEEIETSRELLRRPDAAFLPNGLPGRGFLQVGNEGIELIQMAWTGEAQPDEREPTVLWPDRQPVVQEQEQAEAPPFYAAVVDVASQLTNGQMAPKPWPSFLPYRFSLQSALFDAQHNRCFTLITAVSQWLNGDKQANNDHGWPLTVDGRYASMTPLIGLVDQPTAAQQQPLTLNLQQHVAIFGDGGAGKTTLLQTVVVSLVATHSPDELHLYVLDLGGRMFRAFHDLPHTGAVIYADEDNYEERQERLFTKLLAITTARQQQFSQADVSNLVDYNRRYPAQALPALLVLIDNFAALHENYEQLLESKVLPLLRRALSVGITFVITANGPHNLPGKLYNLFGERLTFKQTNTDRYIDILGQRVIALDNLPGRGYIKSGKTAWQFQAALPVGNFATDHGEDHLSTGDELARLAHRMQTAWATAVLKQRHSPELIAVLPKSLSLQALHAQVEPVVSESVQALLGETGNLEPAWVDLVRRGPHCAIAGPPRSGKSTTLYTWVISLASHYTPTQVGFVFVDLQRNFVTYGGQHSLATLPHHLMTVTEPENLPALAQHLETACHQFANEDVPQQIYLFIDNYEDFSEEVDRNTLAKLATLARRYGRDGLHIVIAGLLEGTSDELRRRVLAANFGIGLSTEQAMQRIGLNKTLPALRGQALPVGRGYLVKSGAPVLLQVATPYVHQTQTAAEFMSDDDSKAKALDAWVCKIQKRYPQQNRQWCVAGIRKEVFTEATPTGQTEAALTNSNLAKARVALQRILDQLMDTADLAEGSTAANFVPYLRSVLAVWDDESTLSILMQELYTEYERSNGMPEEILAIYQSMDNRQLLNHIMSVYS